MRSSALTHRAPATGWALYWLGRLWFLIAGWTVRGEVPDYRKLVIIAAPHTSNWDLVHMLAAAFVFRVRLSWLGKRTIFEGPFGGLMRRLGGIPVDRSARRGAVQQVADRIRSTTAIAVAVAPSGTRKRADSWRSGFYWIARAAEVPILCGTLDYAKKEACLGLCFEPTGDLRADMDRIRSFYRDIQGRVPALQTPIRLREEEGTDTDQTR